MMVNGGGNGDGGGDCGGISGVYVELDDITPHGKKEEVEYTERNVVMIEEYNLMQRSEINMTCLIHTQLRTTRVKGKKKKNKIK